LAPRDARARDRRSHGVRLDSAHELPPARREHRARAAALLGCGGDRGAAPRARAIPESLGRSADDSRRAADEDRRGIASRGGVSTGARRVRRATPALHRGTQCAPAPLRVVVVRGQPEAGGSVEKLNIGGRAVGHGEPPYIIAEIGANHNGDMELCRRIIDAAVDSGADAVKFQSWTKSSLISKGEYARNTRYTAANAPTLEQAVEQYQLSDDEHADMFTYARERGIAVFSSCFSPREVDLLETLDAPAYKIASMDVNHLP